MKAVSNLFVGILVVVAVLLLCTVSTHTNFLSWVASAPFNTSHPSIAGLPAQPQAHAASTYSVVGKPTISASYINSQLCAHHSPACGTGQALYDAGVKYGIDPAYALAFFWHESNYGVNGVAKANRSLSNTRCIPNYPCPGGYAAFPTWGAGYEAWYQIITSKTYAGGGRVTVAQIIPIYAPQADHNNEAAYIASVQASVDQYRSESHP